MKYTDDEKQPEQTKPIVRDSTLGGENYGLQGLANRIAASKRATPLTESTGTVKGYADGGEVSPLMQGLQAAGMSLGILPGMIGGSAAAAPAAANAVAPSVNAVGATTGLNLPQMQTTPTPQAPDVDADFMAKLNAGTTGMDAPAAPAPKPATPSLSDTATSMNQTPPTDYSFYQPGMTADDRLALQQKLMASQNSPGQMVAQGAAGLGDAISNSFGGKNTTFQKDVMADNELQQKKQLGAIDTGREQKLQDMNANIEAQKNDPNSPISVGFRQSVAKLTGQKLPSGMPASIGLQILGPAGELAMKQATLAVQQQTANATIANQDASRRIEAAKGLQDRSFTRKAVEGVFGDSDETKLMRDEVQGGNSAVHGQGASPLPHGIPDLGQTFNGQKVMKVTRVK